MHIHIPWTHWFGTKTPKPHPVNHLIQGEEAPCMPFTRGEVAGEMDKIAEEVTAKMSLSKLNLLNKLVSMEPCHKCGGLFDQSHLAPTLEATFDIDNDGVLLSVSTIAPPPRFNLRFSCRSCKTDSDVIFKLKQIKRPGSEGKVLDTLQFSLSDLGFQEIDEDDNPLFSVTEEDYSRLYCDKCGATTTQETQCEACTPAKD